MEKIRIRDKVSDLIDDRDVGIGAEESDMEAAVDKMNGDLSEVMRKPAFRGPGGTDIKSDDLRIGREIVRHEIVNGSIADEDVSFRDMEVRKAGGVENLKMRKDLMHRAVKVRTDFIEEEMKAGLRITDDELSTRSGSESRGTFGAVKVNANIEVNLSDGFNGAK